MSVAITVLALAPVYRGVGFVVLDQTRTPLDWGVKETRFDKLAQCRDRVAALILLHKPHVVVLECTKAPACRRRKRLRELIEELTTLAQGHGLAVSHYDRAAVATALDLAPNVSKDTMGAAIANVLPPLAHRLPPSRRAWESEKHSMAVFEAAGLALAHFRAMVNESVSG